ncbi:uncharacterized protein LOC135946050 isoform X1 [Cloeon dipterum]|uniref:uncharacterized protein LOC135946050 isoform X1 n=1 Tax=Cloeon dipterum TaxID=197152 RepID=UPI00321FCD8D
MVAISFLLCCPFLFIAVVEQGQAVVVTDADPSEYPYAVRFHLFQPGFPFDITYPGMVVSSKFVLLTFASAIVSSYNFTITDQFGVARTPVKNGSIVSGRFTYFKVCNKFRGAKYPLRESDFNNLTTAIPDAQIIFYNATSTVLRKVTVPVMNKTACATATNSSSATMTDMCVDSSGFTDLCPVFFLNGPDHSFGWNPVLAIGGQVQGLPFGFGCDQSYWKCTDIALFLQNLTSEIPVVDIFV